MTHIAYADCGLNISDNVSIDELKQALQSLSFTEKNHAYFIGDLLCHLAASKDKECKTESERQKYSIYKTFIEQNKHSRSNLEKYHKVCKSFTLPERQRFNKTLSFSHFYEALTLTKADKNAAIRLLDHAAANDLSLSETRAHYRTETASDDDEPEITLSPVVALCDLANELGRKLTSTRLTEDETELLVSSLMPVLEWAEEHAGCVR